MANHLMTEANKTTVESVANGAQVNVLESVTVNAAALTITSKGVTLPQANATDTDGVMTWEDKAAHNALVAEIHTGALIVIWTGNQVITTASYYDFILALVIKDMVNTKISVNIDGTRYTFIANTPDPIILLANVTVTYDSIEFTITNTTGASISVSEIRLYLN